MSKEIQKTQPKDLAANYCAKFKDTPIVRGLIKHGKEKLADKISANFYLFCRKNQAYIGEWTQESIVEALIKSCQWELVPDGMQSCLVPYGKQLTWQPMYQGILEVAYRTGIFKSIVANVVYEGDFFDYDMGGDCFIKHKLDLEGSRVKPIAVYADVRLTAGGRIVKVMTIKEVQKIQNKAKNKSIWGEYWDQMAIKTVIKQVFKLCPKSEGLAEIVAYDNSLEQDFNRLPDTSKAKALNNLIQGTEPEPDPIPEDELDDNNLTA